MKSIIVRVVVIVIGLFPIHAAAQGPTGHNLLEMCSNYLLINSKENLASPSDEQFRHGMMCLVYVQGIRDVEGIFNYKAELERREQSFFCIPDGIETGLIATMMGHALQNLAKNSPEALNDRMSNVAFGILGVLFSCDGS